MQTKLFLSERDMGRYIFICSVDMLTADNKAEQYKPNTYRCLHAMFQLS